MMTSCASPSDVVVAALGPCGTQSEIQFLLLFGVRFGVKSVCVLGTTEHTH